MELPHLHGEGIISRESIICNNKEKDGGENYATFMQEILSEYAPG